jgi:pyruvate dehydrogenase (quinone)
VLDVMTDKNVPPLPGHITFEQAKGVAHSVLHGDPDGVPVIENSAQAVAARMFAKAHELRSGATSDGSR